VHGHILHTIECIRNSISREKSGRRDCGGRHHDRPSRGQLPPPAACQFRSIFATI
jgi:hypothetical protein